MLIKDLKPISEKLYQAALEIQETGTWTHVDENVAVMRIPWSVGPYSSIKFWSAVSFGNFDTARRIDKEKGWGLFEEEPSSRVKIEHDGKHYCKERRRLTALNSCNCDNQLGVNPSLINDGLPQDHVPPQAPRKAISFLYNDKQREEAERIDRARKRARFT